MVSVVSTRLRPPTRSGAAVPREVLPTALTYLRTRRMLLVHAPAGYGKSLLMAQIYNNLNESNYEAAWISISEIGRSLQECTMHCATALTRMVPNLDSAVKDLLEAQTNASPETISALFCNRLANINIPGDLYLFIDDLHVVAGSPSEKFFRCLLQDAPAQMHFAIASRTKPDFNIARLRALGDIGEIGTEVLRFSKQEAQIFFENSNIALRDAELIDIACTKTESWPAGLQLLSLSVSSEDQWLDRLQSLSGSNRAIGTFLTEDVFSAQSDNVQRFLTETSVLRQFNCQLCDEVGQRSDSREIMQQIEQQGLFIFSLDEEGQWYRYHHLFSQFLQKRLSETEPSLIPVLHLRASHWFQSNDMLEDAMFHAFLSREFNYAAEILDQACIDLFYRGQLLSLMKWVKQIPEHILKEYPKIQLTRSWNLMLEWRFEEASSILATVYKYIRRLNDSGSLTPETSRYLSLVYQHRKMMLSVFSDDMHTCARQCNELLVDFPDDDPYLRGSVVVCQIYAERENYCLDSINRLDQSAREYFERAKRPFVLVWHESILGPALIQLGELERAEEGYRSAIKIADSISGHSSPLGAMPATLLAELLIECGQYKEAKKLWDQYLPVCEELGLVDHLIAAYVGRARLAALYHDEEMADKILSHATWLAEAKSFDRLLWHVIAEKIKQSAQRNDLNTAIRIANEAKLPSESVSLRPTNKTTSKTEAMAVAWIRFALFRGFTKEAESLSRRWHTFAVKHSCIRTEIRMNILIAVSRLAVGDDKGATRVLMESLALAIPRNIVLPFLEEGETVKLAVADIFGIPGDVQSDIDFTKKLLNAYKVNTDRILMHRRKTPKPSTKKVASTESHLSQREIDILELISQGLQNKEIADRLCISEGTVKWYIQEIFSKLGVRRRLKAFQKAKEMGLIR